MAIINGTTADNGPNELRGTIFADEIYGLARQRLADRLRRRRRARGRRRRRRAVRQLRVRLRELSQLNQGVAVDLAVQHATGGHADGRPALQHRGRDRLGLRGHAGRRRWRNVLRGEGGNDALYGAGGQRPARGRWRQRRPVRRARATTSCVAAPGSTRAIFGDSVSAVVADLASGTASGASSGNDRLFGIENLERHGVRRPARRQRRRQRPVRRAAAPTCSPGGAAPTGSTTTGQDDSSPTAPDLILDFSRAQGDKIDLAEHRRQRARDRQPGVHVHRPGPVHGRGPAALLPAGRRHLRRGQHRRRPCPARTW